jgi:serine/threonine-protein kinase
MWRLSRSPHRNIAMSVDRLGRYEIIEDLGRGAMGVVYRARDPLIDRTVAIKTIACAGLSRDEVETFEGRFFREAQSAGRLNHPNIVTIHEVGRDGDLAFIVMEFLEGNTLRSVLDSGLVLTEAQVVDIAAQVADGLAFAHANGVVHRDIKPANIFVLANGTAKIADFGVALMPTGSSTLVGTVFGSPKYMSPEQVAGQTVDGRSDIFALGAVLYEMLTGVPPFQGDDLAAILHAVLNTNPPPPSARRRKLHPGFDRIVARAMAKDPAQRYQTAYEMAADLAACEQEAAEPRTRDDRLPAAKQKEAQTGRVGRIGKFGAIAAIAGIAVALAVAFAVWPPPGKKVTPKAKAVAEAVPVAPKTEAPAKTVAPPKPAATKKAAAPSRPAASSGPDWGRMRQELAGCGEFNFICQGKIRWRYCPGHWGTVPDCPKSTSRATH